MQQAVNCLTNRQTCYGAHVSEGRNAALQSGCAAFWCPAQAAFASVQVPSRSLCTKTLSILSRGAQQP